MNLRRVPGPRGEGRFSRLARLNIALSRSRSYDDHEHNPTSSIVSVQFTAKSMIVSAMFR